MSIYFDNSATTKPFKEVLELFSKISIDNFENPSSLHIGGLEAENLINDARVKIASLLGVLKEQIIFTSCGTESNNLAILGCLKSSPRLGKHIITTKIEHPSVLEVYRSLEQQGYNVEFLDVDSKGLVNKECLCKAITSQTALVSLTHVNGEIGTILDVFEICEKVKRINPNTFFHVDAIQSFGKLPINLRQSSIDMLSISSHKIHGLKGVGALFIKDKKKLSPILLGGGQEDNKRSGTQNVAGICSFALASEMMCSDKESYKKVLELNQYFRKKVKEIFKNAQIISPDCASPYVLNVSFKGTKAEVIVHALEQRGILVSTGSACSSKKKTGSHVLKALGLEQNLIQGALRFSFSRYNNIRDVDTVLNTIFEILSIYFPKVK